MRHHKDTVANVQSRKTINGKKLIKILGVGAVVFTLVMGFGTYFLANVMSGYLSKHPTFSSADANAAARSVTP